MDNKYKERLETVIQDLELLKTHIKNLEIKSKENLEQLEKLYSTLKVIKNT